MRGFIFGKNNEDPLTKLIRERSEAVAAEVLAFKDSPDAPSTQQSIKSVVEELGALVSLAQIRESARARARQKRLPLIAAVGSTVFVASILLFVRTSTTEVELESAASDVTFTVPGEQGLLDNVRLSSIGVQEFQSIELPQSKNPDKEIVKTNSSESSAQLSVDDTSNTGTITLNSLVVPAGTRVSVAQQPGTRNCVITLAAPTHSTFQLEFPVSGTVEVKVRVGYGSIIGKRSFAHGRTVRVVAFQNLVLDLVPMSGKELSFRKQLPITGLSFMRVEQYYGGTGTLPRMTSGIVSGTLYLESLNSKTYTLRPSEELQFSGSDGLLRALTLRDTELRLIPPSPDNLRVSTVPPAMAVRFHGRVRGMATGSTENRSSLMPTLLEWWAARQGLWLFWGSILSAIGLIATFLRWLGVEH